MKTFKLTPETNSVYSASPFFETLEKGEKFFIKFKFAKRWKFKAFRFVSMHSSRCDCCGHYTEIAIRKGGKTFTLENHFGENFLSQFRQELVKTNTLSKNSF